MSRNIWFDYLTTAYVQVGRYTLDQFYRPGRHQVQGLGNITHDTLVDAAAGGTASGDVTSVVYDFTVRQAGRYSLAFSLAAADETVEAQIKVNGVDFGNAITSGVTDTLADIEIELDAGDRITIEATGTVDGDDAPVDAVVSDIRLTASEFAIPETFIREWATFSTANEAAVQGYDSGAYGIGVSASSKVIEVPKVKRVHLLYKYDLESTRQERTLVQVEASSEVSTPAADLGPAGIGVINADLSRKVFNEDQFWDTFADSGYNRFGSVWPKGMKPSNVGELTSVSGNFVTVEGDDVSAVQLYVSPLYIENERPLFDAVYLAAAGMGVKQDGNEIEGYLIRWRGGIPSREIAPINRSGDEIVRNSPIYRDGGNITEPKLVIDGIEYDGADAYNVSGYRRH